MKYILAVTCLVLFFVCHLKFDFLRWLNGDAAMLFLLASVIFLILGIWQDLSQGKLTFKRQWGKDNKNDEN